MAYRMAVGSTDGINIDESFGSAKFFFIYEADGTSYHLIEKRIAIAENELTNSSEKGQDSFAEAAFSKTGQERCQEPHGCGSTCQDGGGNGCHGGRNRCSMAGGIETKVSLVSDCRCIICKKIGFQAQKRFEKHAITSFDIDCSVSEALEKIVSYFSKVDSHVSLRGISSK